MQMNQAPESARIDVLNNGTGDAWNVPAPDTESDGLPMQSKANRLPVPRTSFDYKDYLASREWALLKRAVRVRSLGICERCGRAPANQTHHKTYKRIGREELADLQDVCGLCHEYLSAVSDFDPARVCCTPDEAWAWVEAMRLDIPELAEAALAHWREVLDASLE